MQTLWQDLRYGARMLAKKPGFTVIAVITLALGIGANTAIFSLANTAFFRPLPIAHPEQVVALSAAGKKSDFRAFSYPNYKDLRDRNEVFSGMIVHRFAPMNLGGLAGSGGGNERVWGYLVSGNYFEVLGVKAALGRAFTREEDRAKLAHPVVVISYGCWQQRFGADPAIIGKDILINGRNFQVVGVAPKGFKGLELVYDAEIWAPMMMQPWIEPRSDWLDNRLAQPLYPFGRLKPGVSPQQAEASLNLLAQQLGREYPDSDEGQKIELNPPGIGLSRARDGAIGFTAALMGVMALVLLLACANLASLLLARAAERRKEIAVRLTLGAGRGRLVRQLLTESLMLAMVSGVVGVLLAMWLLDAVAAFKPPVDFSLSLDLQIDWRVLLFALGVSALTGLLFGLAPAWQSTRPDLVSALKEATPQAWPGRSRLRNALVVAQVTLSLVLLIAAGLVARSLQKAQTLDLGFEPGQALTMALDLNLLGYDAAKGEQFQRRLLERVRALPGVRAAALADLVPLDLHYASASVYLEGQSPERGADAPRALYSVVWPQYFETMQTPLVAGREFTEQDKADGQRVVVVNETFVRRFFPGLKSAEEAIGRRYSRAGFDGPFYQIVGVARDGKYRTIGDPSRPFVWFSMLQRPQGLTRLVARTEGDPQAMVGAIRGEIQKLDAGLPVSNIKTLTEHLGVSLFPTRVAAALVGGFGLLALALAAIGIYGVTAYTAAQRTREIGIRMALGAQAGDVLKLVVGQGVRLALLGVGVGLAAALALTRLMKSLLFGVSATDPLTFISIALLLTGVALAACYLPARRAIKVDPMIALRHE